MDGSNFRTGSGCSQPNAPAKAGAGDHSRRRYGRCDSCSPPRQQGRWPHPRGSRCSTWARRVAWIRRMTSRQVPGPRAGHCRAPS